jgi:hypothetical protein
MANPADALFADLKETPRSTGDVAVPAVPADALFADLTQQQQPKVGPISDVGKSAAAGVVKGVIGMAALPGAVEQIGRLGVNYVGKQFGADGDLVAPQATLPQFSDIKKGVENKITGKLYEPKTTAGQYAGTIAEFLPGMLFPAAGFGSQLARRAALNVAAPAVVSETAGQATKGTALEPYARAGGAIVGSVAPQMVGRMVSPGAINTSTAKGAERANQVQAMRQEGVPLSAGDVSGNRSIKWAESVAADTPGAAGKAAAFKDAQSEKYVQAVLEKAGISAKAATPEVLDDAFTRIGHVFENAASRISVPLSAGSYGPRVTQMIAKIADDYERITEPSLRSALPRAISDDINQLAAQNSHMTGDVYNVWRSQLGAAARGAQDPRTRDALYTLQNALDDVAERWVSAAGRSDVAEALKTARKEYRNLLAIERAAVGAGENTALGMFSPQQLAQAVRTVHGQRNYSRGRGDLVDLARGGSALMAPMPNSGTPARLVMSALGAAGGSAIAGAPGAAAGVVAPLIGQAVAGRAIMNPTVQRYLSNQVGSPLVSIPPGNRTSARIQGAAQFNETDSERKRIARELAR